MALTYLFVPAHDHRKAARAAASDVDAVIFDLEDAVAESQKETARQALRSHVELFRSPDRPELWVRVNGRGELFAADLSSIDWSLVDGVFVARAQEPETLRRLQDAGAKRLIPLIETAKGFGALPALADVSATERFAIGTFDLLVDLRLTGITDPDESELIWQLRGQLVVASRQLGVASPIDGVYARLDDDAGIRAVCARVYKLGYAGKLLIHPRQIAAAHSVFVPNEEHLQFAREVVDAYDRAMRSGIAVVRAGGRMIDRPMVEQARALLARGASTFTR